MCSVSGIDMITFGFLMGELLKVRLDFAFDHFAMSDNGPNCHLSDPKTPRIDLS